MTIAIGTITTANYWPYTAVLLESLSRICPEWHVYVLALNELPEAEPNANVTVVSAEEVWGLETAMCQARFNLFEWAAASKAKLLAFMLNQPNASLAIYVDSDIEFFSPPNSIATSPGSIVLTPNIAATREIHDLAWERIHLQYGAFNTGLLAVRNTEIGRAFLHWWDERITRYCCTEPSLDVFSDQRWIDLAPGLFPDVFVDRSPALNVATWNLRARDLQVRDGRYWVGEEPLSFFHYHRVRLGMDVDAYLAEVNHHPAASSLVNDYLKKAARHSAASPDGQRRHDQQADGTMLPPVVYRAVRDTMAEGLFDADDSDGEVTAERLRSRSFKLGRFRARLRVLAYTWAHARQVVAPEADIDRYQASLLYRAWIDLWFFCHAARQAQLPVGWLTRSSWSAAGRKKLAAALRTLARR
jgi:hypothetical protein